MWLYISYVQIVIASIQSDIAVSTNSYYLLQAVLRACMRAYVCMWYICACVRACVRAYVCEMSR